MGGRGSKSGLTLSPTNTAGGGFQIQPPQPAQQPPQPQPTPPVQQVDDAVVQNAIGVLAGMTDDQLAQLAIRSKTVDMPNMLNDVDDKTQKFVYAAGMNEKPQVLDDSAFSQFLSSNNIPRSAVLARSFDNATYKNASGTMVKMTPQKQSDMLKYSRLTYIGGKNGGQRFGGGTYFDQNGGVNTGYGSHTVVAVLNPQTARVITKTQLISKAAAFSRTHPKFTQAVGTIDTSFRNNNMSIYALAMGYNVISDRAGGGGYHNVIDRAALIYRKSDN